MDRQGGRKVGRQIDSGQIDSQIDIEADGQIGRYEGKGIERQGGKQIDETQIDKKIVRQLD